MVKIKRREKERRKKRKRKDRSPMLAMEVKLISTTGSKPLKSSL